MSDNGNKYPTGDFRSASLAWWAKAERVRAYKIYSRTCPPLAPTGVAADSGSIFISSSSISKSICTSTFYLSFSLSLSHLLAVCLLWINDLQCGEFKCCCFLSLSVSLSPSPSWLLSSPFRLQCDIIICCSCRRCCRPFWLLTWLTIICLATAAIAIGCVMNFYAPSHRYEVMREPCHAQLTSLLCALLIHTNIFFN